MATLPIIEAPLVKDFEAIAGDTFYFAFRLLDDTGAPIDLTDWDGWLEGKISEADAEPTISLRVGTGFVLGGAAGTVTAKALPDVTREWPVQSIGYRLKLKDEPGDVRTFFTGTIMVRAEIAV